VCGVVLDFFPGPSFPLGLLFFSSGVGYRLSADRVQLARVGRLPLPRVVARSAPLSGGRPGAAVVFFGAFFVRCVFSNSFPLPFVSSRVFTRVPCVSSTSLSSLPSFSPSRCPSTVPFCQPIFRCPFPLTRAVTHFFSSPLLGCRFFFFPFVSETRFVHSSLASSFLFDLSNFSGGNLGLFVVLDCLFFSSTSDSIVHSPQSPLCSVAFLNHVPFPSSFFFFPLPVFVVAC